MKSLSHLIVGMLMAATIFLSAACEHRDLCYDHSHWTDLKVEFDWSEAPDATPRTMVVYLFPRDGGLPQRYEITDVKNGTKVRVPSGEFDAVTFNGDTETLKEQGTTYANFVVTTANESLLAPMERNITNVPPPRPDGTENDPVKQTPDKVWSGSVENISIVPLETPPAFEVYAQRSYGDVHYHLKGCQEHQYGHWRERSPYRYSRKLFAVGRRGCGA